MDTLSRLVDALRCLPGVGPKSAQRMVFHLLQHQRQRGLHLASCLQEAMNQITQCVYCNNYTTDETCSLCANTKRHQGILCVVEGPSDAMAIEQTGIYQGLYFVLMGKISPLDGIGPKDIGLEKLLQRIIAEKIKEVILALSPTVEGQTTVHFIQDTLRDQPIVLTQLAHGIPSGGELAFLDGNTIGSALRNREKLASKAV